MNTVTLTVEEGNALVALSSGFKFQDKLGDHSYTLVDQSTALDEVRLLYKELRRKSPLMQLPERYKRFGPERAWSQVTDEDGKIGYKLIEPLIEVTVNLDVDIISGIIWCLIVALHPQSAFVQSTSIQEDLLYPIAIKMCRLRTIREYIGLVQGKSRGSRWDTDDEHAAKEKAPRDASNEASKA